MLHASVLINKPGKMPKADVVEVLIMVKQQNINQNQKQLMWMNCLW
jgi:hypothetical protein